MSHMSAARKWVPGEHSYVVSSMRIDQSSLSLLYRIINRISKGDLVIMKRPLLAKGKILHSIKSALHSNFSSINALRNQQKMAWCPQKKFVLGKKIGKERNASCDSPPFHIVGYSNFPRQIHSELLRVPKKNHK